MRVSRYQTWRWAIILIMVGLVAGCTPISQGQGLNGKAKRHQRFSADDTRYEKALAVYSRGDYKRAMDMFSALSRASIGAHTARKARMGEICCRLLLAKTMADYAAAAAMWRDLYQSKAGKDALLNPALFDPLIARLAPTPPAAASQQTLDVLEEKANQATRLQDQLDQVMAENLSLKEKIKALEAIDQNMRKKKTEIAAPGE